MTDFCRACAGFPSTRERRLIFVRNRVVLLAVTLTCREYGNLTVGDGKDLTEKEADRLCALAERARQQLHNKPTVLTRTRGGLKAGQVVGVLAVPGKTLEILPKIDRHDQDDRDDENDRDRSAVRKALVHMLAVAHGLRVADGELASLATQRHDLLELLIGLFAKRLLSAVRRGLPRRYIGHEDDLKLLRGRLNVIRQVTHLAARPDLLACRFDELSEDTPLNRVLKAAVRRLARVARTAANARRLAELTARFEFTGDSPDPLREPVRLDRTNTTFHDLHRLARLFLTGDWQSTTGGKATGFTLLFPMNELFERFIGESLKRALDPGRVRLQDRSHSALLDDADKDAFGEPKPLFNLQPDAVIETPAGATGPPTVLDTKWKRLTPHEPRCERTLGVDQSDVYQMLAYARAYGAGRLILLYPWHKELGGHEEPHKRRSRILCTWTVAEPGTAAAGSETACRLDVAVVDVGSPGAIAPGAVARALRTIVDSGASVGVLHRGQADGSVEAALERS